MSAKVASAQGGGAKVPSPWRVEVGQCQGIPLVTRFGSFGYVHSSVICSTDNKGEWFHPKCSPKSVVVVVQWPLVPAVNNFLQCTAVRRCLLTGAHHIVLVADDSGKQLCESLFLFRSGSRSF